MGTTYAVGLDSYKSNNRASSIYTCSIHSTWVLVRALPEYRTLELQHPGIDYIKPTSPWISWGLRPYSLHLLRELARPQRGIVGALDVILFA